MFRGRIALFICLIGMLLAAVGCAPSDEEDDAAKARTPQTIRVPQDAPTISTAVGRARPGDLVLVSPGVYHETARIPVDRVVLRGTDRNRVIIDGQGRRHNGVVVTGSGVAVENLTVRDHLLNGVLVTGMASQDGQGLARGSNGYEHLDLEKFPPLQGFRVSYVTSARNGLYGIYAFNAQSGRLDHNHTSGGADSGLYVGQCKPCNVVVSDNVAEYNAVGYEGTNASEKMWVLRNRLTHNRVGMTVNSDYLEAYVPQHSAVVAGNLVADNAEPKSPQQADGGFGIGIGLAGGQRNTVHNNRIEGNPRAGLVLMSAEDVPPTGNAISSNTFSRNGVDAVYAASDRAPGKGNCLTDNALSTTAPKTLAAQPQCSADTDGPVMTSAPPPTQPAAPAGIPFRTVPEPPDQPQMPGGATAPVRPATGLPGSVDADRVPLPGRDLLAAHSRSGS
ncbi:right-handed parallel beta-helix repeat-containing protein [Streptomyces sp. NBC_01525]|uniref:right-handed parallel beta-helix repeat-containing protein n=1 Tax=Streptomyces sp. NBC_01525 TaxID=2903893 RepID=UPI00386EB4B9